MQFSRKFWNSEIALITNTILKLSDFWDLVKKGEDFRIETFKVRGKTDSLVDNALSTAQLWLSSYYLMLKEMNLPSTNFKVWSHLKGLVIFTQTFHFRNKIKNIVGRKKTTVINYSMVTHWIAIIITKLGSYLGSSAPILNAS